MTKQRNKPKPAPRSVDLAFKIGLPLLVVAAAVSTFLPESRTALSPGVEPRGNASAKAPAAPEAAPPAPIPATVEVGQETPIPGAIAARADVLLVEKMLKSDSVADLNQFGNALLTRGDSTNAARVFGRAIALDAESEINHFNLGLASFVFIRRA